MQSNLGQFQFDFDNGQVQFDIKDGNADWNNISSNYNLNQLTKYTGTYNHSSGIMKFYLNDILIGSNLISTDMFWYDPAHQNLIIGCFIRGVRGTNTAISW